MTPKGQMVVDAFIYSSAVAWSLLCIGHIVMFWWHRRHFCIVLRSPRLACALGLSSNAQFLSLMYVLTFHSTDDESTRSAEMLHLISLPALWTAEVALVLTAVRLLVMYYPSQRSKWGRFTREVPLTCGLAFLYVSMEIAVCSVAFSQETTSVAAMVRALRPVSALVAVVAAAGLGGRLTRVYDANNMSRDIRLAGGFLLGMPCIETILAMVPMPVLASKYLNIGLLVVSNSIINWIWIIRPVREVVLSIPERRRHVIEALLVAPHRMGRRSSVAVTSDTVYTLRRRGSTSDANRLESIMSFLPLREAFGEFCRRSLTSESFQFLVDVDEYRIEIVQGELDHADGSTWFKGYGSFLAIVNDYIKNGAHSEINIDYRTKRDITRLANFKAYALLDLETRRDIFSDAAEEMRKMLTDNLLNRFILSAQYKAVVHFEAKCPS